MTDTCAQCGGKIPPRPDPRGRRAKYCSDACRAAASRERARQRHAQEVEAARLQATLDLKTPQETLAEIVQELEATTRIIRDRGDVPASLRPLVNAASALVVMSRDVVESVEGYAANRRVVSVVVVEVEPAGQRQASFGL